ncbi:hypothetical protein L9F63_007669, partial [Diploptera punctata]
SHCLNCDFTALVTFLLTLLSTSNLLTYLVTSSGDARQRRAFCKQCVHKLITILTPLHFFSLIITDLRFFYV